jgi:hypothetical protein
MQKLKYQKFHDLKPYHLRILRENSTSIAFSRLQRNDYLVVAKSQDMFELKSKLFPKTNQSNNRRDFEASPPEQKIDNTYRSRQEIIERYISN